MGGKGGEGGWGVGVVVGGVVGEVKRIVFTDCNVAGLFSFFLVWLVCFVALVVVAAVVVCLLSAGSP